MISTIIAIAVPPPPATSSSTGSVWIGAICRAWFLDYSPESTRSRHWCGVQRNA